MIRKIITIKEDLCDGCGICVNACHEGAIGLVDGKAKLLREDYCDGLGDCLPACPRNAISFEEREAPAYNEAAVLAAKSAKKPMHSGCPSSNATVINRTQASSTDNFKIESELTMWPVQIKLVAPNAAYFEGCNLLIAADCTAYAYGNFHRDFIKGQVTLVGCPKLDDIDYSDKLSQIFRMNNIKSITLTRMIVPCCGGMAYAVTQAIEKSEKEIPLTIYTIDLQGNIVNIERK